MGIRALFQKKKLLWYGLFFLPILLFFKGIGGFPYPSPEAIYSDLAISHYPNALYLKRSLLEWGQIPLWSPTILSGYPFFANPLSGLWYPPGWLALLLPLPLGFNLLVMLHLLWGAAGMLRLLRREGHGQQAALFGALAFLSLPKLFAQYGAGHLTLLYAIPWTPWLLVAVKAQETGVRQRKFDIRYLRSGIVLALIFLADPRWAPFAGLLWLGYVIAHRYKAKLTDGSLNSQASNLENPTSSLQILTSKVQFLLSNTVLAALLAAPLTLPLLEYSRLSTRNAMAEEDIFTYSLPPARLLGLIFPDFGGFHEWMMYLGGVVLVLILVALLAGQPRARISFWGSVFALGLLISLGNHIPFVDVLARIPGLDLLRVPSRALFIVGLAGSVLAAYGVERLLSDKPLQKRGLSLLLVSLAGFCIMLALGVRLITGLWALNFVWGAGVILLTVLWILFQPRVRLSTQTWFLGLMFISLVDWMFVDASLITFRHRDQVLSEGVAAAAFLDAQQGSNRIYSPSYSLPQQTAAYHEFEIADGVDPLQISAYADFMKDASGVSVDGYSVTLPPFEGGDPQDANAAYTPDAALLGLLNVGYVVSEFEIDAPGLTFEQRAENSWIYSNEYAYPRAWVESAQGNIFSVADLVWTPNQIRVQASGPGQLVLSEIDYPGWRVEVDGQPDQIRSHQGLLRSVLLEDGEHEIAFSLRPKSLTYGLVGFVLGILWLILAWRPKRRRGNHQDII
jgi:hypothetical protein